MNDGRMNMYPHLMQFEENRLAVERDRRLRQEIRAARAAQRAQRPSRIAALMARVRRAPQNDPCAPLVEGC